MDQPLVPGLASPVAAPDTISELPSLAKPPSVKKADITYAALLSGKPPVETYNEAKAEVASTGTSSLVNREKLLWEQEQEVNNKLDVESILADPTIPAQTRQSVALKYIAGGFEAKDLRDKYLMKLASRDTSTSIADKEAQDIYSETVLQRDNFVKGKEATRLQELGPKALYDAEAKLLAGAPTDSYLTGLSKAFSRTGRDAKEFGKAALSIGSNLVVSIGAGLAGLNEMIGQEASSKTRGSIVRNMGGGIDLKDSTIIVKRADGKTELRLTPQQAAAIGWTSENNPEKVAEIMAKVQAYAYNPTDVGAVEVKDKVQSALEVLDIPFKWLGDTTFDLTGSAKVATGVYTGTSVAGYGGAILGTAKVGAAIIKVAKPSIPADSLMATVEVASKEAASQAAVKVVSDPTETLAEVAGTTKSAIVNDLFLPKLMEEFGEIHPDARVALEQADIRLQELYDETEFHPALVEVSKVLEERAQYVKVMDETTNSHLMLSSSVIGTMDEAFGRVGTGKEALIDTSYKGLTGTAVYGRNANHGYKTQAGAQKYLEKLAGQTDHLPHINELAKDASGKPIRSDLNLLERDGEFFVAWNFKRDYNKWEEMSFSSKTLSAHMFSKNFDVTWFANKFGDGIWPAYMRMDPKIPAVGATTALKEGRIEGAFLKEQKKLVLGTDHPKELVMALVKGSDEGKIFTREELQTQNPNLTTPQIDKMHGEYVSYRRIQDHLYRFSDRAYRHKLEASGSKTLFDKDGKQVGFVSEPIDVTKLPPSVVKVWDMESKGAIQNTALGASDRVVKLQEEIRIGSERYQYARITPEHQLGGIHAGALTKIPGYISRQYKEWFVLEKTPTNLWVNGVKISGTDLKNNRSAVAMGGTRKEIEELQERFALEDPENTYEWRREKKNIEDVILHDSQVYNTYLSSHHKRNEKLPSLDRDAVVEDVLVAQTKSIKGVAKVTAWDALNEVNQKQFVKAFGEYTQGTFPRSINDIKVPEGRKLNSLEEREFLTAQKIFEQWERQQVSEMTSDVVWKESLNAVADVFEKMSVESSILREWGEKGFVPLRAVKALGAHLFMYWNPMRQLIVQTQQLKELAIVNPSFALVLKDIPPIMMGLYADTNVLSPLKSQIYSMGNRTTKDYDAIVKAMQQTGIFQSVDMNQMIHGFMRDSYKELDPAKPGVDSLVRGAADKVAGVVALPGKLGRAVGFDPAELFNQVALWLYSKNKWEQENPGKVWDKPENLEEISQLQTRMNNMAATRAGMFTWQDGLISSLTQFVAIPWKSTMQMISGKEFTGPEKARLAAARLFWYGKYGIIGGDVLHKILDRNIEDEETRKNINNWTGGATDKIWNSVMGGLFDASGETTSLSASKSVSTVVDSVWFWDLGKAAYDQARGEKPDPSRRYPFISAGSSLYTGIQGMYDLFTLPPETGAERDWGELTWKAVSFAGQFSAYTKSQLGEQIAKGGATLGHKQTGGEAAARLFGVVPSNETVTWETIRISADREKSIKADAKMIHERLFAYTRVTSPEEVGGDNEGTRNTYYAGLKAFLARLEPGYAREIELAVMKADKNGHKDTKESIMKNLYIKAQDVNDKHYNDMQNHMRRYKGDPELEALLTDLDKLEKR